MEGLFLMGPTPSSLLSIMRDLQHFVLCKETAKILPCQPHKILSALERCSRVFVLLSATVDRLSVTVCVF